MTKKSLKGNKVETKNKIENLTSFKRKQLDKSSAGFPIIVKIGQTFNSLVNHKWLRISIPALLLLLFYSYYSNKKQSFTDDVEFGFDAWEYQSLAVNFANGHGIYKFGCIENFEDYKFGKFDKYYDGNMDIFIEGPKNDTFYRTPGYPLFLGAIYKIFGVSPLIARKIQLFLLCFICAFLPLIGYHYWKNIGFLSGVIAGTVAIDIIWTYCLAIYTESLVMFFIFLIIVAYIFYERKQNWYSALLLGLIISLGLLVKGTLLFMPPIIGLILLYKFIRSKEKKLLLNFVSLVIGVSVFVFSWSLYATIKTGKTVIISTQKDDGLYDGNNEFANGGWAPGWKTDKNSFYNNDGLANSSAFIRVANFYMHYPKAIIDLPVKKIVYGFIPFVSIWLIIAMMLIDSIGFYIYKYFKSKPYFLFFNLLVGLPLIIYILYQGNANYDKIYDKIYGNNLNTYLIFIFSSVILLLWLIKNWKFPNDLKFNFKIPDIFVIFILNIVFITVIILADIWGRGSRYVLVLNYMFVLMAVQYMISYTLFNVNLLTNNLDNE